MKQTTIDSTVVRELAALLEETGLSEIEYDTGTLRVRVCRNAAPAAAAPAVQATVPAAQPAAAAGPATADPAEHPGAVKSPMVGVAYVAPEPGTAAFVQVGDSVSEGDTLLLIEAMKTFNPVRAPRAGTVKQILVSDGTAVEYGEPLMIVE